MIAAIQGVAGRGLIAAACDLRDRHARRAGVPIARTLEPPPRRPMRASSTFSFRRAAALIYTAVGERSDAHAAGFVHEIVPPESFEERVRAPRRRCGPRPITLRVTKEAIRRIQAARPS